MDRHELIEKELKNLQQRVAEIEAFLKEATEEEDALQTEDTETHDPAVDYMGKDEVHDLRNVFIGTEAEKLQWIRDDYTPFEQNMWEGYDAWSVMTNNTTVSFNEWLKTKFPQHVSPGYTRACQLLAEANRGPTK